MTKRMILAAVAAIGTTLTLAPAVAAQTAASDSMRLKLMLECDAIKAEAMRLTCYDSAARRSRSSMGGGRLGMAPGTPAAQALTPEQKFGMTAKVRQERSDLPPSPEEVAEIDGRVASATDRGPGLWRVNFADGSRWQMTEAMTNMAPPRTGETVRIRKATMGSYLMYVGKQPSVRVVRVH
jgi:hypothetical protein